MPEAKDWIFRVAYLFDGSEIRSDQEVFIRNGEIIGLLTASDSSESAESIRRSFTNAKRVELRDGLMMPGLINSHHHAYSALARGIPISEPLPDFPAILNGLWWKLDRALDEESIRVSALLTVLDSIRHGCTTIIDHHSSPSLISGSLDLLKDEFNKFNLSGLLCYEATDRNREGAFKEAVAENLRFIETVKQSSRFGGMMGLHAPFTLSDESLKHISEQRPEEMPIHIHVAEDETDIMDAKRRGYSGPLARLDSFGLLDENSLIVHGVHLEEDDISLAKDLGLRIAHNPESNCNNHVGYADPARFDRDQVLLGTDGMSSNMLYSMRFAAMQMSNLSARKFEGINWAARMLFENPSRYLTAIFDRPVGEIRTGIPADFAIFNYDPPTPLTSENAVYHLAYGLGDDTQASWVFTNGEPVLEDGKLTTVEEKDVLEQAWSAADKLWTRFKKL